MSWITDRLPWEYETDEDGDVLVPPSNSGERSINWRNAETIKLGDPWLPAPPVYVPPKTREELVQDLFDAIDAWKWTRTNVDAAWVMEAREKLK